MKRDFSETTYKRVIQYVEEVTPETFVGHVIDVVADVLQYIKHLFTKPSAVTAQDKLDRYCKEVIDKRNLWIEDINNVYTSANSIDEQYAAKGALLCDGAEHLLNELRLLVTFAASDKLSGVAALGPLNVTFSLEKDVTNDELIAYLKEPTTSEYQYRLSISNVSDTVLDMGVGTALLISLFHHKDILIEDLMSTPGGQAILNQVKQNMVDGKEGYDSVENIAEELGLTPEQVRVLIKADSDSRGGRRNNMPYWREYADVQKIVEKNLRNMLEDESKYAEFAEQFGVDSRTATMIVDNEINGYEVALYKTAILDSLEQAAKKEEREDINVYPDEVKQILNGYQKWFECKYESADGSSDALKKILENNITSEEEARYFMKKYCEYDVVTTEDIEQFQKYTQILQGTEWLGDVLKTANKGVRYVEDTLDAVAYLVDDYTKELDLLGSLEAMNPGSAEYQIALKEVRETYENKAITIVDGVIQKIAEEGLDKAMDAVPGLSVAETVIGTAGKITGASGYASAAEDIIAYSSICVDAVDGYGNALLYAKEQNYSESALRTVRNSFEIMKCTLVKYYDAQITYAEGMNFDIMKDQQYKAYLEYEKKKIEDLTIGQTYTATSYETYLKQYGDGGMGLRFDDV